MILSQRVHLFPFRTQKLSSAEAKILVWRRTGKIAHRQHRTAKSTDLAVSIYILHLRCRLYSSLAQSVEHLTVNQGVAGSSPAGGAKQNHRNCDGFFVAPHLLDLRRSDILARSAQGARFISPRSETELVAWFKSHRNCDGFFVAPHLLDLRRSDTLLRAKRGTG